MQGLRIAFLLSLWTSLISAQVCRLSVAGLNQSRRVVGAIHAECPESPLHSAPFGNWGATSNFGQKGNSHQFDGWCHNSRTCDNTGACQTSCVDGWYEWNSCTDEALFRAPNCTLYNSAECTEQVSTTGINVHGTRIVDVPVSCPADTNGDGVPDTGGCSSLSQYASGTNFISLYELDPVCCDQLVQTVYFPAVNVPLLCDALGCAPSASPWLNPAFWDSPATPGKIFAQMSVNVNFGEFVDSGNRCRVVAATASAVSSASFLGPNLAPESIATILGASLAPSTEQALTSPLPTTLGGVTVVVTDRAGVARTASLFYVSPKQINFLIPAGVATGPATINVQTNSTVRATAKVQIDPTAPAIFTQNADGRGVPAALLVRVGDDGVTRTEPVFSCGTAPGTCVPIPLELSNTPGRTFILLFGTGIRGSTAKPVVTINGSPQTVDYAGPQNQYAGLDQVNVALSPALRGAGLVDLTLTADGKTANTVRLQFR